jgi:uncharacterized membrane protein YhiD involved in acid resistance
MAVAGRSRGNEAWAVIVAIVVMTCLAPLSMLAQTQPGSPAAPPQSQTPPAASPPAIAPPPVQTPFPIPVQVEPLPTDDGKLTTVQEVRRSLVRLPLAAALGAALALRPKRRGTPPRQIAVVQTQIVLAGVGAVIMLIVGTSLARAFGIVGAANLIRYRSKIDDPKDAVVMLCALAVGLASGVGLYLIAILATLFLLALLWVIESFQPKVYKTFDLKITAENEAETLRPRIEQVLKRFRMTFEGRSLTQNELTYEVQMPFDAQTGPVSQGLVAVAPHTDVGVVWTDKQAKTK